LTEHRNLLPLTQRTLPMHYKTITLELLRQYPDLHETLRTGGTLRQTMERYAVLLKERHLAWTLTLTQDRPGRDPAQLSGEALEMALQDLREALPAGSSTNEDATQETLPLDAAMASLRRHTPPAS
jgi:hypothetical protein